MKQRWITPLSSAVALGLLLWSMPAFPHDDPNEGGGEPVDPPVHLFGAGELSPPEGAENQDASGTVFIKQRGDRMAVHIHVRGLTPGATYDVRATSGETSESIGSITTHPGTPPPPRCFKATLAVPPPPPEEGEEGGDGGGGWFRHRGDGTSGPVGHALLYLNSERTQLHYWIGVRGLGDVASATLVLGEASIPLDVEDLKGMVDVTEEQVAALSAEEGVLTVVGDGETPVTITGAVEICFEELRERVAAWRAGRGALRIDTSRGDTLPLGADDITDLVGVTFSVVEGESTVVLAGSVAEVNEPWHRSRSGGDGGGGGLAEEPADTYFEVAEVHDASFVRGDANDDELVNLSDAVFILGHLFQETAAPYCTDAADANDSGVVDISDPILILNALYQGTGSIRPPFPESGFDATPDELFCQPSSG
jgi:hypothetical protein